MATQPKKQHDEAARINEATVRALAQRRKITEEEALFALMKNQAEINATLSDWDDVRSITVAVIRELKPYLDYWTIYLLVLRVMTLYSTHVISLYQSFSDVKRLALFLNEMLETCLENEDYAREVRRTCGNKDCEDRVLMRGLVLTRIAPPEVMALFLENRPYFFKAEWYCARRFFEAT